MLWDMEKLVNEHYLSSIIKQVQVATAIFITSDNAPKLTALHPHPNHYSWTLALAPNPYTATPNLALKPSNSKQRF